MAHLDSDLLLDGDNVTTPSLASSRDTAYLLLYRREGEQEEGLDCPPRHRLERWVSCSPWSS